MESFLSVLFGGAVSTVSGVVFWFLNGRTSRGAQDRQHSYEMELQRERLEADRRLREDEAIRTMRRARLDPVFQLLRDLETELARDTVETIAKRRLDSLAAGDSPEAESELLRRAFPSGIPVQFVEELRKAIVGDLATASRQSVALIAKAMFVLPRIGDEAVQKAVSDLLESFAAPPGDAARLGELRTQLAKTHELLETYVARTE